MRRFFLVLALVPFCCFGQNNVQDYVNGRFKSDPNICNSVSAVFVVGADDRVIAAWNENLPLESASTMKLVTTGVALKVLGPDYRFSTSIMTTGEIDRDGTLKGDVYIVGGGDPTLGSDREMVTPIDSVFSQWYSALYGAGVRRVEGSVVGDARFFCDDECPDEWSRGDTGYYYGSTPSGLSFAENLTFFQMRPGLEEGDPVILEPLPPFVPGMTYVNTAVTGAKGSGDHTTYYATELAPYGRLGGTLAAGTKEHKLRVSNKYSALTCAYAFEGYLEQRGMEISYGSNDSASADYDSMTPIVTTFSPSLASIIDVTNHESNNFFAETLFRTIGKVLCGKDDYASCAKAVSSYVSTLVPSLRGYNQYDGSGLSSKNLLSTSFICSFLDMMSDDENFRTYFSSLPVPGENGTLSTLLSGVPYSVRRNVRAKSGSIGGCKCYTGYVKTRDGLVKFSMMSDHFSCPSTTVVRLMNGLLYEIALLGNQ